MKTAEKIAHILLKNSAVTIRPTKPFRYTSGLISPIYTDLRLLISLPKERRFVIGELSKLIKKLGKPNVVAGTATAGIPHAAWISEKLNIPMIYVRSSAKAHGKKNQIEGVLKKGQKVYVVEDLISTGGSSITSVQSIRKMGGVANKIIAIFSYTMPVSKQNFKKAKVSLHNLITFSDMIEAAARHGYIKDSEKKVVLDWSKDPKGWGKKMGFE